MEDKQKARLIVVVRLSKIYSQDKLEILLKALAALEHEGYLKVSMPDCSEESLWLEATESLAKGAPSKPDKIEPAKTEPLLESEAAKPMRTAMKSSGTKDY